MARIEHVPVETMDPHRFKSVLATEPYDDLLDLISRGARELRGRVIWNVNSTAKGGGVAELLGPLLGYSRGAGVDARWVVITGNPAYFAITKRLHNHLHGFNGDSGSLGQAQHEVYEQTLSGCAAELVPLIHREDIVILHDPQTAGLLDAVRQVGPITIWRCHVGRDRKHPSAREAWSFLRPYVIHADAFVFSRPGFVWEGLPEEKVAVIQPSIDAFSPKNQDQSPEQSLAILARAGIIPGSSPPATFTRSDGSPGRIDRGAVMIEESPLSPRDRLVTQISRWDRLKDPLGVMGAFAQHVALTSDAHLLLGGPAVDSVSDDPEGATVLASVRGAWERLPQPVRSRIHLASLPMEDTQENAAIVNALQRHSTVIVQKSLAEGFGLTVAEAMWKERPVVASRLGGIQDQIVDGESGILIERPRDHAEFAGAVIWLLNNPEFAASMGRAAHARVRDHFLGPYHLERYFELIQRLLAARGASPIIA